MDHITKIRKYTGILAATTFNQLWNGGPNNALRQDKEVKSISIAQKTPILVFSKWIVLFKIQKVI